jgi:penicillin amidase
VRFRTGSTRAACWIAIACAGIVGACKRSRPGAPPTLPQVAGTVAVEGLNAPVQIIRDRWGIPHIVAARQDDLFLAQGFVQAQDRLFQMDLWRRAAQGRLAEVLGANFIERDAMTRRFQYRGDLDVEWASYGPDTKTIAEAFVRGVNAWVAHALEHTPEQFTKAGWKPAFWSAIDLLNRTDAFRSSGDAIEEVRRSNIPDIVADAIRSAGAPPFFAAVTAPARDNQLVARSTSSASATRRTALRFSEVGRSFNHPSIRYIVHLKAPGWNVIGMTSPWLPGVAAGHNEQIAWGMAPIAVDTQDVFGDPIDSPHTTISDAVIVKRRKVPFAFDTAYTRHGVVVALDRARNIQYAVRWSGTESGAAADLAALSLDRASTWTEFRSALTRWKMPARRAVYADSAGNIAFQDAALVPVRRTREWTGWIQFDALPHALNPADSIAAVDAPRADSGSPAADAVFAHVLGIGASARQRFNIGPITRPRGDDAPVRAVLALEDWDRSSAINAPGQSGHSD